MFETKHLRTSTFVSVYFNKILNKNSICKLIERCYSKNFPHLVLIWKCVLLLDFCIVALNTQLELIYYLIPAGPLSFLLMHWNHTFGVMVSMPASSVVDRVFECRLGQTKNIQLVFDKHASFRSKSEVWWLSRNQDNDVSISVLFQLSVLIYSVKRIPSSFH